MRTLLLLLLLSLGAGAQEVRMVTFLTDPPGAEIYLEVSGQHRYETYLGRSGEQPVPVSLDLFQGRSSLDATFRLADYYDKTENLKSYYFQTHDRWPETGVIRLQPRAWWVPLRSRLLLLLAGLVGLVLAGMPMLSAVLRQVRWARRLQARIVDRQDPLAGRRLGSYRLLRKIGSGALSQVYEAVPEANLDGEAVAIKVFDREAADDPEFVARFRREWRISTELRHPNIVCTYGGGEQDGIFYLVMELLQGGTLRDLLSGPVPAQRAVELITPILEAVAYAHGRGVVHRDLKPENVAVSDRVKVLDFGLARARQSSTQLTRTGTAVGTPAYMAPEQITGQFPDGRSDQYSLGVMLYEMLAGRKPFEGDDVMVILHGHLMQEPPPLESELQAVVMRMLAKEPEERFSTLEEVLKYLRS